jgi:Mrp family chromosome partitioning ATPase
MNTAMQVAQEFRARHDYSVRHDYSDARPPGAAVKVDDAGKDADAETEPGGPTLEELEVTADTYRKMYESFLQAYTSSVSQQSYPVADARVITPASPPLSASHPRSKLVMIFGALFGIVAGVGLAFVRNTLDKTLRSPRQVRDVLGLECVGELPSLGKRHSRRMDEVARAPHSEFSHGLRRVKTAISLADTAHPVRWLGITSTAEDEGKCATASNLATLYAMSGQRVLVIDADVYCAGMTNLLLAESPAPWKHAAGGPVPRDIVPVPNRLFDMLPSSPDTRKLLVPKTMQAALEGLASYDIVIVVLPSFISGAENLMAGSVLDGVLLVARWGRTPMEILAELVRSMHASKAPIVGVLMTGVRMRSGKRRAAYNAEFRSSRLPFNRRLKLLATRIGNAAGGVMRRA